MVIVLRGLGDGGVRWLSHSAVYYGGAGEMTQIIVVMLAFLPCAWARGRGLMGVL